MTAISTVVFAVGSCINRSAAAKPKTTKSAPLSLNRPIGFYCFGPQLPTSSTSLST
jgi:hypothetical protein